jgi:2-methylcitrate dehydratase PrpD
LVDISEIIAGWVVKTAFDDLPPIVIKNAKRSIIDTFGVALAGSKTQLATSARMYAAEHYANGKCNIMGSDKKLRAGGAAFANCVAARVLDYDDTCYSGKSFASVVHASAVILPAVWAASEELDLTGREFLTSFILGSEAEYFLCRLLTANFFAKGWFTASSLGIIGAAVSVGKAKNLNLRELIHTIGLAVSGAANTKVCLGTDSNALSSARAAEGGICAAELARLGASAPSKVFEGSDGFLQVYNSSYMDENTLHSLGKLFAFSGSALWYKLFPICTAAQAAAEVTLCLCMANNVIPEKVVGIHCTVSPLVLNLLRYRNPRTPTEAQFSLPFAIACGIVFRRLTLDELNETVLRDQRIVRMMNKVEVSSYREGGVIPSTPGEAPEKATVKIVMTEGGVFTATKEYAVGTPENPMSDQQLEDKFLSCGKGIIPERNLRLLLGDLQEIESKPSMSKILSALFACPSS